MKTPSELKITRNQRRNFAKLAVRFRDLRPNGYKGRFSMTTYCTTPIKIIGPQESIKSLQECGTSACLAGHAKYLNIGKRSRKADWESFVREQFGVTYSIGRAFPWVFGPYWNNDRNKAVKRIAWMLERGWPNGKEFNCAKNTYPVGFDTYKPDWAAIEKLANN